MYLAHSYPQIQQIDSRQVINYCMGGHHSNSPTAGYNWRQQVMCVVERYYNHYKPYHTQRNHKFILYPGSTNAVFHHLLLAITLPLNVDYNKPHLYPIKLT